MPMISRLLPHLDGCNRSVLIKKPVLSEFHRRVMLLDPQHAAALLIL